jgi:hypothetical protein
VHRIYEDEPFPADVKDAVRHELESLAEMLRLRLVFE